MTDAILIPLEVFGIGFAISMCMAVFIKVLMDIIQHFSKKEKNVSE